MASNIHYSKDRRHWWMKYWDGEGWKKRVLGRAPKTWKGKGEPPKPPEVLDAAARLIEAEREARSAQAPAGSQELAAFLGSYLARHRIKSAPASSAKLSRNIDTFLAYCGARKITLVSEITRAACADFLAARAAEGRAHNTIKNEMGMIAGAWSEALKVGRLAANPWTKQEVPAKPARKRKGSWTPEQFAALVAASRPWLRDILELGTQTGLRITALTSITWKSIEWPAGEADGFGLLRVPAELDKAGKGYSVPLSPKAHDLLQRILATRGDDGGPILRGETGRPTRTNATFAAIRRACDRAGLPVPDSPNHHMRRTFGRWAVLGHLVGHAIPLRMVSAWMGHASQAMTERYLEIDEQSSINWMVGK